MSIFEPMNYGVDRPSKSTSQVEPESKRVAQHHQTNKPKDKPHLYRTGVYIKGERQ